jgi:hypothetical protein
MLRKDVREFIKAIRNHDNATASRMLQESPDLVTAIATSPPKKDDGQSPLQIAFKTGNFEIAELLLSKGADTNYHEKSEVNEWTGPVLHDAIRAAFFSTKTLRKDPSDFQYALRLLEQMLILGADPGATDSYGNTCLGRGLLDAAQMIKHPNVDPAPGGTIDQARMILGVLIKYGADVNQKTATRESAVADAARSGLAEYDLLGLRS